jgi:hypothetical protein
LHRVRQIVDKELGTLRSRLRLALSAGVMVEFGLSLAVLSDKNRSAVKLDVVELLNGSLSFFAGGVFNNTTALRATVRSSQNISKNNITS